MDKRREHTRHALPAANIKVVGIGGCGGNAVSRMTRDAMRGVEFIAVNTDHQDLDECLARKKVYIGRNLTRGLGTGMNPEIGRQAAEESRSDIAEALRGADLVFLAAGLGGGTGSGATAVVAEIARQQGALTLGFVTKPFSFEGSQRERIAQEWVGKIKEKVDALIVIPNDRVFTIISKDTPIVKAFEVIDEILKHALRGIVDLIVSPGIVNLDFADVRTILRDAGSAMVGMGIASGADRAVQAVEHAVNSPLLDVSPEGAKGILLGISGRDLKMNEINEAAKIVAQMADPGARIIFGAYHDRKMRAKHLKITLIATGFNEISHVGSLFGAIRQVPLTSLKSYPAADDSAKMERERHEFVELSEAKPRPSLKQEKTVYKKKDSDVWDIPAFLRKRKR